MTMAPVWFARIVASLVMAVGLLACDPTIILPGDDTIDVHDAHDSESGDTDEEGSPPASLMSSPGSLFVGEYRRIPVQIPSGSNYEFDDLIFDVVEGSRGGLVSDSRDEKFDPEHPVIMLLGGWVPGQYTLRARHEGIELSRVTFELTDEWSGLESGPPIWFEGVMEGGMPPVHRAAWGEGAPDDGLENHDVIMPQIGNRKLLLIFHDFPDVSFPADATQMETIRKYWMDNTVDGYEVSPSVTRSVAGYWEEVSGGRLTVSADTIGPIRVNKKMGEFMKGGLDSYQMVISKILQQDENFNFKDYFSVVFITPTWHASPSSACTPSNEGVETCDGRDNNCNGLIDSQDPSIAKCADSPVCGDGVVDGSEQCDDGEDNHKWGRCDKDCRHTRTVHTWPIYREFNYRIQDNELYRLSLIQMPHEWETVDGRPAYATLAHEFGHALGLGDLYAGNSGHVRSLGRWDLMANEHGLPHISLSQRMMLGWVDDEDIFSFKVGHTTQSSVALSPVERPVPASETYRGVEVRLTGGHNYYWEYRLGQSDQLGDRQTPIPQAAPGVVLGTDHLSAERRFASPRRAPEHRRPIALVPVGSSSDGPALSPSQMFLQNDVSPESRRRLMIYFSHLSGDVAHLEIDFDQFGADPAIRPWPSSEHRWQSPDIEIVNAKNQGDGPDALTWKNVPWAENPNEVIARVRNLGNIEAPDVEVNFYAQLFNASGEGENSSITTHLGWDRQDVGAGEVVEFKTSWRPPASPGHYCIRAEIKPYAHPQLIEVELSLENNVAQSNYTRFWSDSSSPARRRIIPIVISNPYEVETIIYLAASQSHTDFRTYLENSWVRLAPNETHTVHAMFEYARDFDTRYKEFQDYEPENRVHIHTWASLEDAPNADHEHHGQEVFGGASISVMAGYATTINLERVPRSGEPDVIISGVVARKMTGEPVKRGTMLVRVDYKGDSAPTYERIAIPTDTGYFEVSMPEGEWERIDVEFLGNHPDAPSRIETLWP